MSRNRPRAVVFDVIGTLFDLAPVERVLAEEGAPPATLEAWFERILHTATALTLAGEFAPFSDVARSTLDTTTARLGLDVDSERVLGAFRELPLLESARKAVERLSENGVTIATLTNSSVEQASALLERAGVLDRFSRVFSVDAVERYKPDPAPYGHALDELGLAAADVAFVAAHAWDVLGAERVSMRAVWIASHERVWPLPVQAGERVAEPDEAAVLLLDGGRLEAGRRESPEPPAGSDD